LSQNNYEIIIKKLDAFVNKYYKNLMIKGGIWLLAFSLSLFIIIAITEYFLNLDSGVRKVLFYSYLVLVGIWLCYAIVWPLLALLRIRNRISYQKASQIIGNHFPEVGDQLSNILQLKDLEKVSDKQLQLIEAGINQKAIKLQPLPILKAINFKGNLKYIRYALIPVFIILLTWILRPQYVEEPTIRLIEYNQEFERTWPFDIQILNGTLKAFQKEDFDLKVKVNGTEWPEQLYLHFDQNRYLLKKTSGNLYHFDIKNLRKSIQFFISDGGDFKTQMYLLEVYPKAVFNAFEVTIVPPAYTGLPVRNIKNSSDFNVVQGSTLEYRIKTAYGQSLVWIKNTNDRQFEISNNEIILKDTITESEFHQIYVSNAYLESSDSLKWSIQMIKDEYPVIAVESVKDTNDAFLFYYSGMINDDYGFSFLRMNIQLNDSLISLPIQINKSVRPQSFYHYFDMRDIQLDRGDEIEYYFEVYDNDAWNGSKSARSQLNYFKLKTEDQLKEERNSQSDSLKSEMRENLLQWKDIQDRIKDLKKELLQKDILNWEDRKKMEDLLKEQENLQKKIEEFNKQNSELKDKNKELEKNERILDKQEQLQELFEQIMDEETKQKMEELRKMLEEMDKENSNELLEQMEMTSEELEDQLDRNLELFKQLEFEMRMEESIEDLKKLAKEQKKLAEETADSKKKDADSLSQKQDSINKAFEELKKELNELDSLNKSMNEPNPMDMQKEKQDEIDKAQDNAKEQLDQKQMDKAAEEQKEAGEQMEQMAMEMQAQMEENAMEQMGEDIDNLRLILDQLIQLSFTQENIMDSLLPMELMDPKYNLLVRKQFSMEQKIKPVRDSLQSLAMRQPMIQPFVLKEFNKLDYRLQSATGFLDENKKDEALREQQYIMTSINQLALMLDEALKNMQMMMNNMMQGNSGSKSQSCPKPGMGKPGKQSMKQMQQQINEQMKAMEKEMKEGRQKGKSGNKGKSMSEKLARMAAEQARIRRMIEEYRNEVMDETGTKPGDLDQMIQQMEQTERDLVNKIISQETLKRQENIMTRLLKSEKAEREREKKKERESEEGKNVKRSNPKEFLKYKELKEKDVNLMKTIPLDFNPYYKKKVDRYFYKFDNIDDDVKK
jgi:hypothetical protein